MGLGGTPLTTLKNNNLHFGNQLAHLDRRVVSTTFLPRQGTPQASAAGRLDKRYVDRFRSRRSANKRCWKSSVMSFLRPCRLTVGTGSERRKRWTSATELCSTRFGPRDSQSLDRSGERKWRDSRLPRLEIARSEMWRVASIFRTLVTVCMHARNGAT